VDEGTTPAQPAESLSGLRGWLLYFMLGHVIWIVFAIYELITAATSRGALLQASEAAIQDIEWVVGVDIVSALLCAVGALLVILHARRTPDFWVLALPVLTLAWVVREAALQPNAKPSPEESSAMMRTMFVEFAWLVYWLRSKRVAATFGSNGLIRAWLNRNWLDQTKPRSD